MEFKTQYNLDDKFFSVHVTRTDRYIDCPECNSQGSYMFKPPGKDYEVEAKCPECNGYKRKRVWDDYQILIQELTVGQIRIEHERDKYEEVYMCFETGVGPGTLHKNEQKISNPTLHKDHDTGIKGGHARGLFPTRYKAKKFGDNAKELLLDIEKDMRYEMQSEDDDS